jgi:hypothetical protein
MKILFVHKSVAILVDHVEGLFELLDLRLIKHGEDIAGGSLGPLLPTCRAFNFSASHIAGRF